MAADAETYAVKFVRGTLADDERRAIAKRRAAGSASDPRNATAYFDALEKKSDTFAAWSQGALASAKITVGAGAHVVDKLASLVRRGIKRATTSLERWYSEDGDP